MPEPAPSGRRHDTAGSIAARSPETDQGVRRGWGPRHDDAAAGAPEERVTARLPGDRALASVIEGDVIPRLVRAHRPEDPLLGAAGVPRSVQRDDRAARPTPGASRAGRRVRRDAMNGAGPNPDMAADLEDLFLCLLRGDPGGALTLVERRRARGESAEALCADLLGPAGHLLETRWAADACGLAELTLGMGHLLEVLRDLDHIDAQGTGWQGVNRRILLAAAPGERHAFGVSMLAVLFQRAGWDVVDTVLAESSATLAGRLTEEAESAPVAVVGLWAGALARLGELPAALSAVRNTATRRPRIILAGPAAAAWPGHGGPKGNAAPCDGVDAVAETAPAAVEQANRLLGARGD